MQPLPTGVESAPPIQNQRPRRSARLARLRLVVAVCLGMTVLLCIVIPQIFPASETTKPSEVEGIAKHFADIKIPEGFQPARAMTADNGLVWLKVARFLQADGRGQLVIGGLHLRTWVADEKNDAVSYDWILNKIAPGIRLLDAQETHETTVEIGGKPCVFEIIHGEDRASTTRYIQVVGSFPAPQATGKLILQAEEGYVSDQGISDLLASFGKVSATSESKEVEQTSKPVEEMNSK